MINFAPKSAKCLGARCVLLAVMMVGSAMLSAATPGGWDKLVSNKPKQVLFFTKSAGFEHSVIKRTAPDKLGHAEQILTDMGKAHGFAVTCSKDGRIFTPENIAKWDAICFYTSGILTEEGTDKNPAMTVEGKKLLLQSIQNGKAFLGFHAASDCFHHQPDPSDKSARFVSYANDLDPYTQMLGAEFIRHGPQQKAKIYVTDTRFPGLENLKDGFELHEEWYTLKDFVKDMHALLVIEPKGMKGVDYQRAPYPVAWAHMVGQGHVYYNAMGHREDVWTNPLFQDMIFGALGWAVGNVKADLTPNLEQVAPGHREIQPREDKNAPPKAKSKPKAK
jgi:type 1 glutamine amidotransferase